MYASMPRAQNIVSFILLINVVKYTESGKRGRMCGLTASNKVKQACYVWKRVSLNSEGNALGNVCFWELIVLLFHNIIFIFHSCSLGSWYAPKARASFIIELLRMSADLEQQKSQCLPKNLSDLEEFLRVHSVMVNEEERGRHFMTTSCRNMLLEVAQIKVVLANHFGSRGIWQRGRMRCWVKEW